MFKNKVAFVTGASRGIGRAIAEALGARGATVIGTATTQAGADAITERLTAGNIQGSGLMLNVTNQESINTGMKFIQDNFGAPTILVNNAGVTKDNLLMRMKEDEWQSIIDTDLTSVYRLSKACLRGMMKARSGRIINISSVVAATGNPGQANYCAAKAGMIGFTKSLAREIGSRGITVNVVAPGFIATDMTKKLPEEQQNALLTGIPLARLGEPKEIANAVVFLASPDASYITGETLHVNGGMHMG